MIKSSFSRKTISIMLIIAFLFSFSTPVFAAAVNVGDKVNVSIALERLDEFSTLCNVYHSEIG